MPEAFYGILQQLIGRLDGPLAFRFVIQPAMAALLGIRAGWNDARAGRPPYGWAVLTQSGERRELLREGWEDVAKLFIAAVLIDIVYEVLMFQRTHLGQSLVVAATLAVPPYLLIRGPMNRLTRHRHG